VCRWSGSTPSRAKKNTRADGVAHVGAAPTAPHGGSNPHVGAPMGGYGGPHGELWGSTALIAPDDPWGRLGLKKDTESVPVRAKKVDLA